MMHSNAIFTLAFFSCVATAVASQPGKIKLHGLPSNALAFRAVQKGNGDQPKPKGLVSLVHPTHENDFHFALKVGQPTHEKAFHVALKVGASTLHFNGTSLKTENITVKKVAGGSDRRLGQAGRIRGGNMKDGIQREQSLQGFKKNSAFAADVISPIRLQGGLMKTSGGSSRRLEIECSENSDGSLTCPDEDKPYEGFVTVFRCPASADDTGDCSSCVIKNDADRKCNRCTMCSSSDENVVSWDCSNLISDDECAIVDCDAKCQGSPTPDDPTPDDPTPDDPTPTDPRTDPPDGEIQCTENSDGSMTCPVEDQPYEGFDTEFRCPASADKLDDCSSCVIENDANRKCNRCTMCSSSDENMVSWDCSNLIPDDECAIVDCDGNCKGSPTPTGSTPTNPTPTDPRTDPPAGEVQCSENSDGSITCLSEDDPFEGLQTEFRCPASADYTSDCDTCVISTEDNGDQCTRCTFCSPTDENFHSWDCSNVLPDEACATTDCDGTCTNVPTPPGSTSPTDSTPTDSPTNPTPTDPRTEPPDDAIQCSENSDGSLTCPDEDSPFEGLVTEYRCPASGETTGDCFSCVIKDNADQCNSCTMCSSYDEKVISWDCSNLVPDEECAIMDCDGNCETGPDTAPTPSTPTPTGTTPSTPTPTEDHTEPWSLPPTSAPVMETAMLVVSATAIAAFSLF